MNAIRRVFAAPGAWVGLWLMQLALAWTMSAAVYGAVAATMLNRAWLDDGHRLAAIGELLGDNPAIGAAIGTAMVSSAVLGFVLWVVSGGAVIVRLAGVARGREALAAGTRHLPEIAVQSLWGLVGRAVLVFLGALIVRADPIAGIATLVVLVPLSAFASDGARVLAVFSPTGRFHPRLYWRALVTTVRRPLPWLGAIVFTALQLAASFAILELGFADRLGSNTLLALRVLALVPLFFALCRVGLAIETFAPPASPVDPGEVDADDDDDDDEASTDAGTSSRRDAG